MPTIKTKIDGNSRISLSDDQLFDQSTANTSGGTDSTSGNTFIGYLAGQNVDAGSVNNTFIGHGVGDATLADATYNVGVGTNALTALTSGEGNTAIGTYAGQSITSGARNTILGYGALGAANGDEDFNTIIGHGAGASIDHDSADNNIIIGYDAGSGGSAAMASCIAIGNNAMNSTAGNAQTGTVAIGHDALTALTDGTGNTAIGYEAGAALTSGTQNVAIGYEALDRASSGANHNVAIGYQSMHGNIGTDDVDECVAIGSYAIEGGLANAASGTVAIGYKALTANTDGGQNTGIGFEVLKSQTTGGGNTAVGYQALHDLNHANADSNVAIGAYAGATGTNDLVNANTNTFIGYSTAGASASAVNQTVIGASTTGQADNSVTLGNASVTDVYMAQDKQATVHCNGIHTYPTVTNASTQNISNFTAELGSIDASNKMRITFTHGKNLTSDMGTFYAEFYVNRQHEAMSTYYYLNSSYHVRLVSSCDGTGPSFMQSVTKTFLTGTSNYGNWAQGSTSDISAATVAAGSTYIDFDNPSASSNVYNVFVVFAHNCTGIALSEV